MKEIKDAVFYCQKVSWKDNFFRIHCDIEFLFDEQYLNAKGWSSMIKYNDKNINLLEECEIAYKDAIMCMQELRADLLSLGQKT